MIAFTVIAHMINNKKLNPIVIELCIPSGHRTSIGLHKDIHWVRGRKLNMLRLNT